MLQPQHASEQPPQHAPLPARPNLEYERKRAKKLLHQLDDGDAEAVKRATNIAKPPFQLADAQLIIAREYGFASWPRLVQYYRQWKTHDRAGPLSLHDRQHFEFRVDSVLEHHSKGGARYAAGFATFIPRFFGLPDDEIVGKTVTREEAEHVVARMSRFSTWEELIAEAPQRENLTEEERVARRTPDPTSPGMRLHDAFERSDLDEVKKLVADFPDLGQTPLQVPAPARVVHDVQPRLLWSALLQECKRRTPEARAVTDWVQSLGFALQPTLDYMLLHCFRTDAATVEYLLERGAHADAVAPSGLSAIDIAVMKYWNGEAVDHVARRTKPRSAFWMAAGLGDLVAFRSYFGPNDVLTEGARTDRPDWLAAGLGTPPRPNATDDMIVWDAWLIAGMNQRFNIMDDLLSRGWPVNAAPLGGSLLEWAEGNRIDTTAEYLRSRGATG